jgi:hypothetical protein
MDLTKLDYKFFSKIRKPNGASHSGIPSITEISCPVIRTVSSVGFEFLTAVVMKSSVIWDITPCSPSKGNRYCGGTCRLHLQGRRMCRARNQSFTSRWFLAWLILRPWRWRRHVPPKRLLAFNGIHSVISQKTELFGLFLVHTREATSAGKWI